jgi:hypothetical protein
MKEHDSRELLVRFLRDDLRRAADRGAPLGPDQLEAYVDGRLDEVDREIVETRLADDAALQREVEALRALRAELAAADVRGGDGDSGSAGSGRAGAGGRLMERLRSAWRKPR